MIMQVCGIQQLSTHAGNGSCTTWSAAPCQQHCLLCMEPFTAVVQDTVLLIYFLALGGINSTLDLNQPLCCVLGPSTAGAVQCLQQCPQDAAAADQGMHQHGGLCAGRPHRTGELQDCSIACCRILLAPGCQAVSLLVALWMCWGCQQVQGLASCICAG
jgi:hypothetical protein